MSEFKSFRFTRTVDLAFASRDDDEYEWEESVKYLGDSVHVFKAEIGEYNDYDLTTPEGRLIPRVCVHLLTEINESPAPKSKRILEAFPAPVPGIPRGNTWDCPYSFNSLRIVRDGGVFGSIPHCYGDPVAYLYLTEGDGRRYDKLYYRCSFFGVPKLAKV